MSLSKLILSCKQFLVQYEKNTINTYKSSIKSHSSMSAKWSHSVVFLPINKISWKLLIAIPWIYVYNSPHPSTLAWRIQWTQEPGGLQSMGSLRVGHDWANSLSLSLSNEHPGLISFRMDWLGLLAVQGTLKSLQHHSSKASVLSVLSFLHSPTLTSTHNHWKTIALTRWTFVGKVMSLLFNMLIV